MGPTSTKQLLRLFILALLLSQQSVFALLNIGGTRNQVFVFGSFALGYDSNIFAQNGGADDYTEILTLGTELKRRAGLISVDGTFSVDVDRYEKHSSLNAVNPTLLVVFEKASGRLTGTLTVNAFRTEQADSAVNLRTTSWNYPVSLSLRYPINDKFYTTSQSGFQERQFVDNTTGLSNYTDFSEGLDAFYVYNSKVDFLGGYRVRFARTDAGKTTDHNFSIGATGGLLPKVTGIVRFGYQLREINGTGQSFSQFSALGQLTWNATRKLTVTGALSRDFSTTATAASVDAVTATVDGTYVVTRRFQFESGIGYGRNEFLGASQGGRLDDFFSWNASATYSLNDHLKVVSAYSYFHNQSNLALAEFDRQQISVTVSSRY